jgi:Ni/Fe-hydrogenase subunit HybB-like protein
LVVIVGAITMVIALGGTEPQRAWEIYIVNLLFWSGISQAGIILSAVMVMTNARWWHPLRRIAEAMASFLPISFVLFIIFFLGGKNLFPWTSMPEASRSQWLDWDSMVIRDVMGIAVLYLMSFVYISISVRRQGEGAEEQNACRAIAILAPLLVVTYTLVYSLLAIDLVMTLSPPWYSTLFGGYFFIGALYTGLAAIAVIAVVMDTFYHQGALLDARHRHDLGMFLLAFCMITGDFFWSQFLVIWYGNIPEEISFLLRRVNSSPWSNLSWAVLLIAFIVPFVVLLSKKVKVKPLGLCLISIIILIGMWLERYVLIIPSTYHGDSIPFGWEELSITLGFASLCLISYMTYLRAVPALDSKPSK